MTKMYVKLSGMIFFLLQSSCSKVLRKAVLADGPILLYSRARLPSGPVTLLPRLQSASALGLLPKSPRLPSLSTHSLRPVLGPCQPSLVDLVRFHPLSSPSLVLSDSNLETSLVPFLMDFY